jgi:hypothetical protein
MFSMEDSSPFLILALIFMILIRFEIRSDRVIDGYDQVQNPYKRKPDDPCF